MHHSAEPTEPALRARKKQQTREVIIEAALGLFAARGFDATTVDAIAEAAEVSRRTFFRYFETKEAVLFANQADRLRQLRALLEPVDWGESPLTRVRRALLVMARGYAAQREAILLQHRIIASSSALMAFDQRLDAHWEDALYDTLQRDDADPLRRQQARWVAGAIVGIVRVVLRDWVAADGQTDLEATGRAALDLLHFTDWT